MVYKLLYTETAQRDLKRIQKEETIKIIKKIDSFIKLENPFVKAKKLKNFEIDTYRFRVGDYRVIFRKDEKTNKLIILVILKILHRKDAYKKN